MTNEYDAGMGTTRGMWELLSEILSEHEEKLPESLNKALYALRDGVAKVTVHQEPSEEDVALMNDVNAYIRKVEAWQNDGERIFNSGRPGMFFQLGSWWADRPWRTDR
jgi:hypothetical protein